MIDRQQIREALTGPVTSISIPFQSDGTIDNDGLRSCIDFFVGAGSKSLILTYGDSLYSLLTDDEIAEVTKTVVAHANSRAAVIAADGMWATPKAVEFARFAHEAGADMLMVLPPDWAKSCTTETLVEHYAAVANEIPLMLVTNLFRQRPIAQSLQIIERVRDAVEGVVAIKDDVTGPFARRMAGLVHQKWAVISGGRKENHLDLLPYGCDGYFSTFSKFYPPIAQAYWQAIQDSDLAQARQIINQHDISLFDYLVTVPGGFDAAIHALLEINGLALRWRRKPYYSLSDKEIERLADFCKQHGWC